MIIFNKIDAGISPCRVRNKRPRSRQIVLQLTLITLWKDDHLHVEKSITPKSFNKKVENNCIHSNIDKHTLYVCEPSVVA